MDSHLLEIKSVTKRFGGVTAVDDVSFHVNEGEIVAVIGPNGAGKTTLFNVISCIYSPTSGDVVYRGEKLNHCRVDELAEKGLTRTFQNLQVFENMSVLENVMLGTHVKLKTNVLRAGLRTPVVRRDEQVSRQLAEQALEQVGLIERKNDIAGAISYESQKLLEIARAIVSNPRLMLLDEPMAGLNDSERKTIADFLLQLKQEGMTLLFVEHDVATVMEIADRIVVIDFGAKIAEGSPREIQENEAVIKAYLGEEVDDAC